MELIFKHKIALFLLKLLARTWRISAHGNLPARPAIVVFWHGKMLPVWRYFASTDAWALVSPSRDGELLSRLLESWDYNLSRGSSSKKGKEALEKIIENATRGYTLITPDGPRGPKEEFKAGAAVAAQKTGVAIWLCGVEISRKKVFDKSWDDFELPLPFSKINLFFNGPIDIVSNASREEIDALRKQLAMQLTELNG
ncbi:MAG: lysophospholipid acyltransferase family protein [Candidatus Kapaibacterium sp.]